MIEAVLLSLVAGLATAVGGFIGLCCKPSSNWMGILLGFTAGVMITVAFMDLIVPALEISNYFTVIIAFVVGALLMFVVDNLLPHKYHEEKEEGMFKLRYLKTGLLIALGITIHNFPEGIAVGAGYAHAPEFGLIIALAIALHNIPEGVATVVPLRAAGVKKSKAWGMSFISGIVEPIGAVLAVLVLGPFEGLVPVGLAFAGGVMTFLTLDEIVPLCKLEGNKNLTSLGIIAGCVMVMLLSGLFGV
jgi:ZIP family zinc transporter